MNLRETSIREDVLANVSDPADPFLKRVLAITQGVRYNHAYGSSRGGVRCEIYALDHPPAHVHAAKAGAIVRIDLATHAATEIVGAISDRDVKRAEQLIARHTKHLKQEWTNIHGRD